MSTSSHGEPAPGAHARNARSRNAHAQRRYASRRCAPRGLVALTGTALLTGFAGVTPAHAVRDLLTTRALSMGGALRAAATGTSAPLLNPATLATSRSYVVDTLYQFRSTDDSSQFFAAIADSVTTTVAAALYYSYGSADPRRTMAQPDGPAIALTEKHQNHEIGGTLAVPLGEWLAIGVTGRYLHYRVDPPSNAPASASKTRLSHFTLDAGGTVSLGERLRVGVIGYNLIPVDDRLSPQGLGLGLAFSSGAGLTLAFDSVLDFSSDPKALSATLHGGLELLVGESYALRAGAQHDTFLQASYVTAGVGLLSSRVGLELGLRQQVDGGTGTLISAAIKVFVQ